MPKESCKSEMGALPTSPSCQVVRIAQCKENGIRTPGKYQGELHLLTRILKTFPTLSPC